MNHLTTKEKILAAAKSLFAENGFAGTSIGKIAALAQVNHSLVFHHFKSKENLWVAVKHDIVEQASGKTGTLPDTGLPFEKFLEELFAQNMKFYRSNPDVVKMINWQRVERRHSRAIGITLNKETRAWLDAFRHYQKNGDIDKKAAPEFIMTLILSIISSAALDPNIFIRDKKQQEKYLQFCIKCILKSLRN
ncbi:HTH-type transcriptional repressor [Aquicella siphonis]|uniref:HTH-type transcriptional repressor n=1 Tax=Aquicella siphonis TaxID=254247 RepID=A0A5E4PH13_9COXI|nr:TetR/AcrR family transcriptional regulator [Aquicella siphonis]VVC75601.1 HTH-type transcriptional repressor [Aquicella siphonis]